MKYLDNIVDSLNARILKASRGSSMINGLVISAGENKWVTKEGENAHFDSDYNLNIYHRIIRTRPQIAKSGGKKQYWDMLAEVELICFSSFRDMDEVVISQMSFFPEITPGQIEYDAEKILKKEIGTTTHDFNNKYIFVVTYNALCHSQLCVESDAQVTCCN